jgi:hypothetical protein
VDRLTNRLAALAAKMAGCTIKFKGDGRLTVSWLTAMKAIQAGQP